MVGWLLLEERYQRKSAFAASTTDLGMGSNRGTAIAGRRLTSTIPAAAE